MGSGTSVVGRVEQVVEGRGLEISCVVVFHGLEVEVSRLGNPSISSAEAVAQHGASDVGAVAGVLVSR